MSRRGWLLLAAVALGGGGLWWSALFPVDRSKNPPRPLERVAASDIRFARFDVVLPSVPVGMRRLRAGDRALLVHFWAPWERHGRAQALALDSLVHRPEFESLDVAVVCFDPFPSVARFVARTRLRLSVVLDREQSLRRDLPCPVLPYTYVIDAAGRIVVAQAGEVDWESEETRRVLRGLIGPSVPAGKGGVAWRRRPLGGRTPPWRSSPLAGEPALYGCRFAEAYPRAIPASTMEPRSSAPIAIRRATVINKCGKIDTITVPFGIPLAVFTGLRSGHGT